MNAKTITFISAGAGSGKTTRLTEILGEKLLGREAEPDGIIATTFTNKAAAELKERVRSMLLEKNRQDLAVSIVEAQIGTVNSVCGGLLKRFAFELGLTMEQKVIDEHTAMERLSRALDGAVCLAEREEITALAQRLGFVDARTGNLLWKDHVKAVIDLARYNTIDTERFDEFARKNADKLLALFPEAVGDTFEEKVLSEITSLKKKVQEDLAIKPLKNTRRYLDALLHFEHSLEVGTFAWKEWLKMAKEKPRKDLHEETERLDMLCRNVVSHPGLHRDIRDYLSKIFSVASQTLGIYQQQKQEMGLVDFADQEFRLLEGLDNPLVRSHLEDKLHLLLVDEFQDTSPIQLALFLKLSSLARKTYWVGDIKQAIYGFRGGDARLMQAVLDFLPEGSKEVLGRSWRSVPSLVGAVNAVFCRSFGETLARENIELMPERREHPSQDSCFRWDLGSGRLEQQYEALAAGVQRLLDEGFEVFEKKKEVWRKVRFGDVAILSRTNARVQKIAGILKQNGIPAATAQPGLLGSPEGLFVTAGLRRLIDPADTLATAELYSLATCSEPEVWLQNRLDDLESGNDPDRWLEEGKNAHPVLREIALLRDRSLVFSPSDVVKALVSATGAARYLLAWCRDVDMARMRLSNMQSLLQLAGEYEEECDTKGVTATLQGLVYWFEQLAAEENDLFSEPPVNAVRVLTYHTSKGLEWPVVVLLDLDKPGNADLCSPVIDSPQDVDAGAPLKDRFIRFWPSPFVKSEPFPGLESVMQSREVRQAAELSRDESARLLYVAMTRARDCLVLGTSSKSTSFPWLEQAGAACFVTEEDDGIVLPDGSRLPCKRWENLNEYTLLNPAGKKRMPLYWYAPVEPPSERLPEQVVPSLLRAETEAMAVESIVYSGTINLHGNMEATEKGTVVHDILAFALTQEPDVCDAASVATLLEGYGAAALCEPESLVRQLGEFRRMLSERWPECMFHIEAPVEQKLPVEQVLKGQIDLLLETQRGWVIIDHKITTLERCQWEQKAIEYSGQLFAYKQALEMVTGKPVESCWIHFFAAGGLVGLDV